MTTPAPARVEKDSAGCLRLSGTLVERDVRAVRKQGEALLGELSGGDCEMDIAGLENASSVVLSLMLCWKREALKCKVDLQFKGAHERLYDLARMSRVADYLGLAPA
ncbi:STAS domain-containing protein [Marinobacter fonticola]|uniref:STAS domain-containing protein n=1 Tax=Marinobacter fonticola TaxID=2603215 RepID=UPI0011E647EF|nr:STAS domain-containing protein [Marinobacter fonticola]